MLKKLITLAIAASMPFAVVAADVIVDYSGPSGMGNMIIKGKTTGPTNIAFTTGGISYIAGNGEGLTNLTGTASANGTTLNALNLSACTNFNAANLIVGSAASAINGAAITNISPANLSGTALSRIVTNAGTGYTNLWTFTNGRLTAYSATGTMP
jgi:hypothetical protein